MKGSLSRQASGSQVSSAALYPRQCILKLGSSAWMMQAQHLGAMSWILDWIYMAGLMVVGIGQPKRF